MNYEKHPDVRAWEAWEGSAEGQKALEGVTSGQYLRNRLMNAFYAGRHSRELDDL